MRVVYINPIGELGGAERCLLDLMASVREARPDAELALVSFTDGPLLGEAARLGVDAEVLPMPDQLVALGDSGLDGAGRGAALASLARSGPPAALALRRYTRSLRDRLRALRPTVVHSNGIKSHLLSAFARPSGVPVLWHVRDLIGERPLVARVLRGVAGRAAGAIAISGMVGRDLAAIFGRLPVDVVYDAIDTDDFSPEGDAADLYALSGLAPPEPDTVRIGLVATYGKWKGHELFLDAIARVPEPCEGKRARFFIVGGPIYRTQGSQCSEADLRERAARLGIADRVGFVGFQRDIATVFRGLDVVVHASTKPEPFGRTIAEAMACAKALVLARTSGAAELIEGDVAVAIPPGDTDALAGALARFIADPTYRDTVAGGARRVAVARFSRSRIGREMFNIYDRYDSDRETRTS